MFSFFDKPYNIYNNIITMIIQIDSMIERKITYQNNNHISIIVHLQRLKNKSTLINSINFKDII